MLEDLALQYSEIPEDEMRLIGYGLAILGGIIGGLTYRSTKEIRRADYFAASGLIFLCIAAVTFGGAQFIVQAIVGGFFWVVIAAALLATVVGGFFLARIAADRSRDAYGHGRMAALAFIPLANLWLLLTPSKNKATSSHGRAMRLLCSGLSILPGFLLFGLSVSLLNYAEVEGMRRFEEAAAAGDLTVAMLDQILAAMAAEVQPPVKVDETTTVIRVEAVGRELRISYEVDPALDFLATDMRINLLQQNCSDEVLSSAFDAGAVFKHIYLRKDGTEIGVVEVTKAACGR